MKQLTSKARRAVLLVAMAIVMWLSSCNIIGTVDRTINTAERAADANVCQSSCYNMGQ